MMKMAKFVKLDSGEYINIDMIITISNRIEENYYAATLGFDSQWAAHQEELTKNDLEKIIEASEER